MNLRSLIPLMFVFGLAACGAPPPEKAIVGTWVQETPTSTTEAGLQSTISETVLTFEKDGDVRLVRQLDLAGAALPPTGVSLEVDLSGIWALQEGQVVQSLKQAIITARSDDPLAAAVAEQLQGEADTTSESRKEIITLDKKTLILQDVNTGTTDVYQRK